MTSIEPLDAQLLTPELLSISWSDGSTRHYPTHILRAVCPCAHCTTNREDAAMDDPVKHAGVELMGLEEVGNYAFQISFSDGHGMGIYTFPHLLEVGFPEGEAPKARPDAFDV